MTDEDPEVEVACPIGEDSCREVAAAIQDALRRDGGPLVQDLLDAGASVESASVYPDAIYATFVVEDTRYENVRAVDRTDGDDHADDA
jgi:hypothetical protein